MNQLVTEYVILWLPVLLSEHYQLFIEHLHTAEATACSNALQLLNIWKEIDYMYILSFEDFIKTKISTAIKGVLNVTC